MGTKYTNNKAYTSNKNRIPKHTSAKEIVMFFLCTVEHYSIIKPVFLYTCKSYNYNKEIGKPDESLGRKATGPVKWQPVA